MADYIDIVRHHASIVDRLAEYSGLKNSLVNSVVLFTKCLIKSNYHHVDRQIFSAVLERFFKLNDLILNVRIYDKLCKVSPVGRVTVEDFARILCMFLSDNMDNKIKYAFLLYDHNGDGLIDILDLMSFVKVCKCVTDVDESEKDETFVDLCHMASECLGVTPEDPIGLDVFRDKVNSNTLLLQILAQCFPPQCVTDRFKAILQDKTFLEIKTMFGSIRHDLLNELPQAKKGPYDPVILELP